jgi:hypothetical protein
MNQDNTPNPASFALAHLPSYYYLYGRASPHADEALNALYPKNEPQYQVFDFSSDRSSAGLDKPPHSVEQLLTHGYFAVPKGEPELSILQDRKQTSWLSLDDVLSQIHQRTAIYEQNMLELEWAKCYAFNELARQGWPATPEQYATYNRRLQDLHCRSARGANRHSGKMCQTSGGHSRRAYSSTSRRTESWRFSTIAEVMPSDHARTGSVPQAETGARHADRSLWTVYIAESDPGSRAEIEQTLELLAAKYLGHSYEPDRSPFPTPTKGARR